MVAYKYKCRDSSKPCNFNRYARVYYLIYYY